EDLSTYLELSVRSIDQSAVIGAVDLTPIQRYFFEDPIFKLHHHFNQSVVLKSKEALKHELLVKSIAFLTGHHDALRMVYSQEGAKWTQFNQGIAGGDTGVYFYDLREEENELEAMAELGEKLQSSFNLQTGPLLKAAHFRLAGADRLAIIIHHLVVDGISWRILLEDLSSLYKQFSLGEIPELPLKTDSFQRWSQLQQQYATSDAQGSEKSYWESICSQSTTPFPTDKTASGFQKMDSVVSLSLDKSITELLQTQVHGAYNTKINDVLLTGLGLAIKETFGLDQSVIEMEGHGREDIIADVDISRTVGWFTSVYPFLLNIKNTASPIASLIEVKEDLRKIPNKGIGYGIQRYLSDGFKGDFQRPVEFNYLGDFGYNAGNKSASIFEYSSENIGSDIASDVHSYALLSVSGMLVSGELRLSVRFSQALYHLQTIENLAASYHKNLVGLIQELSVIKEPKLTPSDLTFKGLSLSDLSRINKDNTLEDVYKLSPLQQGIYYHWLSDKTNAMYFEQMSYRIKAPGLSIASIEESYNKLVSRHGVLRTSFTYDLSDHPLQLVRKQVANHFSYRQIPQGIAAADYIALVKLEDKTLGFDLETPSQMRLGVLDLGNEQYEFIWSHHHILSDGWCMSILIKDFYQFLHETDQKTPLHLPKPFAYSNYIQWLDRVNTQESLGYWKTYLQGYEHVAGIPFTTGSKQKNTYLESKESLIIEGDLYAGLNELCAEIGVTQNTFMQGVWGYLLSKYNNTQDVVFGTVVSGRPADLEGVEDMIGLFINTIPVRVKYNDKDTPLDLLKQIQQESIWSKAHHYLNLSDVQSQSELGMNLIDHIMAFENYPVQD
ncbi:condensation domain-containing protein, partial [Flavobacterium sp. JAS]|uniref:condensation domain-containing protein n=1 Tax=Flavobacterium sp. JAS TaxID=2897329 RepID=UPI001E58B364